MVPAHDYDPNALDLAALNAGLSVIGEPPIEKCPPFHSVKDGVPVSDPAQRDRAIALSRVLTGRALNLHCGECRLYRDRDDIPWAVLDVKDYYIWSLEQRLRSLGLDPSRPGQPPESGE